MSRRTKHAPQEIDGKWWDAECARIFNELAKIGATTLTISKSEGGGAFWYQLGNETPSRVEAAALIMKEALENLENDDGAIPPSAWEMVQTAIADAGGTPKGAPATDIRAEVAALRQSLAWAINTFQGESGMGDNYWEQFPEYVTACALVADTNTQPKEEAP